MKKDKLKPLSSLDESNKSKRTIETEALKITHYRSGRSGYPSDIFKEYKNHHYCDNHYYFDGNSCDRTCFYINSDVNVVIDIDDILSKEEHVQFYKIDLQSSKDLKVQFTIKKSEKEYFFYLIKLNKYHLFKIEKKKSKVQYINAINFMLDKKRDELDEEKRDEYFNSLVNYPSKFLPPFPWQSTESEPHHIDIKKKKYIGISLNTRNYLDAKKLKIISRLEGELAGVIRYLADHKNSYELRGDLTIEDILDEISSYCINYFTQKDNQI